MLDDPGMVQDGAEFAYIESARKGDLSAFNWLVLHYQARVYNLCLRMLSDPDSAADATQETFLSAYKAMNRFKGGQFRAWLLRIATNTCLDMLRSRKRRPSQSLERGLHGMGESDDDSEPLQLADPTLDVDPEGRALTAEVAQAIQRGLDELPDDQRIALVLVDVQGLSYEEAATVCNANLGTVKSRINRARSKMRDYLRAVGLVPHGELSGRGERSIIDES